MTVVEFEGDGVVGTAHPTFTDIVLEQRSDSFPITMLVSSL